MRFETVAKPYKPLTKLEKDRSRLKVSTRALPLIDYSFRPTGDPGKPAVAAPGTLCLLRTPSIAQSLTFPHSGSSSPTPMHHLLYVLLGSTSERRGNDGRAARG